jgi:benzoate membrane transport protein
MNAPSDPSVSEAAPSPRPTTLLQPAVMALVAAIVGCSGSIVIVLGAAAAVRASPEQTASWLAAACLAIALSTAILSIYTRLPLITAWSTPGAALIAISAGPALTIETAVGAFLLAAGLTVLTALVAPLTRLIERLPTSIAAAMLAGILLKLVMAPLAGITASPGLILPMLALFLVLRALAPSVAVLGVLAGGAALAHVLGLIGPLPDLAVATLTPIRPAFDLPVMVGLGVPLYLVTMASQNLAGVSVLKASGYPEAPVRPILLVTGIASAVTAPFGSHATNLAAISAAICTGPDCHPDPARRWLAGPPYALCYLLFALYAPSLVGLFSALPPDYVTTLASVALMAPLFGSLATAFGGSHDKFAPGLTFVVTFSGLAVFGIGAAFWGLLLGLLVWASQRRII